MRSSGIRISEGVATMTVPGACKDHNVVTVKKVEGGLLRREESYTEAEPFEEDHNDDEVEIMYSLKQTNSSRHAKMAHDVNFHSLNQTDSSRHAKMSQDVNFHYTNGSPALRRNVRAWCDATGLPTTVTIRCKDRVFHLHKFPLVSRSGYLKKALKDATEVTLPSDVPGGAAIFELVSNFCYGSTILMEPANIAQLCCVADYLQMTEDYGRANLCERSELYLTQVALQSWDDTLVVLEHCAGRLGVYAEKLGIERRCLEALAFMACMELLDPVAARKLGNGDMMQQRSGQCLHWWVQDLVALPPRLFVHLVLALRREGMQENCVGQVITAFADHWIFGSTDRFKGNGDKRWTVTVAEPAVMIESVVSLLPLESDVVPIGFLFALLRRGLACALSDECRIQLETRIVLQLENATLHDLLLPGKKEKESRCVLRNELESMERILKLFLTRIRAFDDAKAVDVAMLNAIAKLWDQYLAEIAFDSSIAPARFADLIDRVPDRMRAVHDDVYHAIHAYLKAHPNSTQEERLTVCRTLNCQKLSQEACAHAVQSELMPLRMIVQAMFMQQLQTRSVLNSHLESAVQSFREHPDDLHSRSMINLPEHHSGRLQHRDSFRSTGSSFRDNEFYIEYAKKEIVTVPREDYQATENRLRNLEAELSRMRKTLARQAAADASSSAQLLVPENCKNRVVPEHLRTPCRMATVHEATGNFRSSGCMSQLKPANRTSHGLLAKTLQKLRSFGKSSTKSVAVKDQICVNSKPRLESEISRTDSMPRPVVTSRVKPPCHARRNSMS